MRKVKLVSVFVLVALLGSVTVVQAQVTPPGDSGPVDLPGLDAPISEWTDADLGYFVDLAFSGRITARQFQAICEQLTEEQ